MGRCPIFFYFVPWLPFIPFLPYQTEVITCILIKKLTKDIIINANISTSLHRRWFCSHDNIQHPALFDIYPIYGSSSYSQPFILIFNWKDKFNAKCFIQDLLFINYHQIYELVVISENSSDESGIEIGR